jgi:hypothetical protein
MVIAIAPEDVWARTSLTGFVLAPTARLIRKYDATGVYGILREAAGYEDNAPIFVAETQITTSVWPGLAEFVGYTRPTLKVVE